MHITALLNRFRKINQGELESLDDIAILLDCSKNAYTKKFSHIFYVYFKQNIFNWIINSPEYATAICTHSKWRCLVCGLLNILFNQLSFFTVDYVVNEMHFIESGSCHRELSLHLSRTQKLVTVPRRFIKKWS